MKYSQWIGVAAALLVIAACYMPWAYFPDLQKDFTGFFSEQNRYGKPGKVLLFLSAVGIILFLVPKMWAKRANIFAGALSFAWSLKSFILYSACYRGICPERRIGIFLVLFGGLVAFVATLLPDLPVKSEADKG